MDIAVLSDRPDDNRSPTVRDSWLAELTSRLQRRLETASPEAVLEAALRSVMPGRFAVVSSFGAESAVLLHALAQVDRTAPVLLLDTGYLFPKTLAYRDTLAAMLGLTDIRSIAPDVSQVEVSDPEGALYLDNPGACCTLRKVLPLARALTQFDASANGRKRYQASTRQDISIVEQDGPRLKFNPLAGLSRDALLTRAAQASLPLHPLERYGYASIGCMPCTSRVAPGEDPRAGRWRGRGKVECGIHVVVDADGLASSSS